MSENSKISNETEPLFVDHEGFKIIPYYNNDDEQQGINYVEYERYKGEKYLVATEEQLACFIQNGITMKRFYIPEISWKVYLKMLNEELDEINEKISKIKHEIENPTDNEKVSLQLRLKELYENNNNLEKIILKRKIPNKIVCKGCIIGKIDFCNTDLKGIVFENDSYFEKQIKDDQGVTIDVSRNLNCVILDKVNLQNSNINGNIDFSDSIIYGDVNFRNYPNCSRKTSVTGDAILTRTQIFGDLNVSNISINGNFILDGACVALKTDLSETKILGETRFRNANLMEVDFHYSKLNETCDMLHTTIFDLKFNHAVFNENLLISTFDEKSNEFITNNEIMEKRNTLYLMLSYIKKLSKNPLQICDRYLYMIQFWNHKKRGICCIDFSATMLNGQLICDFDNVIGKRKTKLYFEPNDKKILINTEYVLFPHEKAINKDVIPSKGKNCQESLDYNVYFKSWWDESQKQYAWLKEQYRKSGAYPDEDKAHWWASECSRMSKKWKIIRILNWLILKIIFGYGVRIKNVVLTIIVIILLCSIAFSIADCTGYLSFNVDQNGIELRPFGEGYSYPTGLYFSIITFATVGFGDVSAIYWAAIVAMIEGLLGAALIGAFIVSLYRRLVR